MTKKTPSISIFFPFLNDWGTVGSLVCLAISTVKEITEDWEVIIVDDGSDDSSRDALLKVVETIQENLTNSKLKNQKLIDKSKNRIRIVRHEKNRGYGGALKSGFDNARKDLVFYTDCDAQYDPRELINLFKAMDEKTDMVNGFKIKRSDPMHRIVAGRIYHHLVKFLFGLPIGDTDCDFRLIRRSVFERVKLFESTGTICVELVKKIDYHGYKIREVPVHHFWRVSGKSQFFNFSRLFQTGMNLLKLWWKLIVRREYYN